MHIEKYRFLKLLAVRKHGNIVHYTFLRVGQSANLFGPKDNIHHRYKIERTLSTGEVYKLMFPLKQINQKIAFVPHTKSLWPTYKNGKITELMNAVSYFC